VALDGAPIPGFPFNDVSDLRLVPSVESFALFPWRPTSGKVARMLCDVCEADGTPHPLDSRSVLRRMVERAAEAGIQVEVGSKCQFFLFHTDDEGSASTRTLDQAHYLDLAPLDRGETARREICLALEQMGLEVEGSHHEVAPGQHEIDFASRSAAEAADDFMTFRVAVKAIAQRNGLHATFMPKPREDMPGSAMRMTFGVTKDGADIFAADDEGKVSSVGEAFMAGIAEHMPALMGITNPLVNSYKRLVPLWELAAEGECAWQPSLRLAQGEDACCLELRGPDPTCNPYLAFACCIAAGLDGIERNLRQSDVRACDLPDHLGAALDELASDGVLCDALGEDLFGTYLDLKSQEWEDYLRSVSAWELDSYLAGY
jgi:glutamine synthetase